MCCGGISDVTIWQMKDPWLILFSLLYYSWQGKKKTVFQNKISEKVLWFSFWRTGWDLVGTLDRRAAVRTRNVAGLVCSWCHSLRATEATQPAIKEDTGNPISCVSRKRILNSSGLSGVEEGWVEDWMTPTWKRQGLAGKQWLEEDKVKTLASLLQRMKGLAS